MKFSKFNRILQTIAAVAISGLFIAAGFILGRQAPGGFGTPQISREPGGSESFLTHVATDKPIYRIGEKVYVRAVVLRTNSHSPMTSPGTASFEIKGPKGDTVASGASAVMDSIVGFSWDIPAGQAGG